jgi:signal transduction histidine kinase/DNA-binding response OmpR family regulator/regulator of replication initiation timing
MSLSDALLQERRARLAAERLLEMKQTELFAANHRLSQHALTLSDQIVEQRQALSSVQTEAEALKDENLEVRAQYARAREAAIAAERQLWAALQTIRDGFALFDEHQRLVIANDSYLAIFDGIESVCPGATWDHILDVCMTEGLIDPQGEAPDEWRARMQARWRSGEIDPEVIRLWNGQFVRLLDRRTPDGGIVTLGVNITEDMRMRSGIEAIPDGFVLFDQDDRMVMSNARYRELYPNSAHAMQPGTEFEEILRAGLAVGEYADAIGREEEWLEQRILRHREANAIVEQPLADGRWMRVFERPTPDGGRVGLRSDITNLKEQQEALKREGERAEAANRAKSAFLANMSHEIRTPMNGVVAMAELLADSTLDDEQRLYVETIRNSGEALLVIINDVLDYSKIEAERLQLHPEPFDLERCIHEVLTLLQPTARQKGLELLVDYDMFLPTAFEGDPGRIRQVLTNLVGNAVKFTGSGHVLVRTVGLPDGDSVRVHITVEDTGIGIPADKIEHIFGEFNQVEASHNRKFEGTGLGLAITRRLVSLMGGEIWVDAEEGVGSSFGFHVTMPVARGMTHEDLTLPDWIRRAIVIEDQPVTSEILSKQLTALGIEVLRFDTVETLLGGGTMPESDVLVMDHGSGGASATGGLLQLRSAGLGCPAILLATRRGTEAEDFAPAGVNILKKPPLRHELLDALARLSPTAPPERPDTSTPREADRGEPRALRVLVAEDNKTNQLVFAKFVKDLDIELSFASNGDEAVRAFSAMPPDLIFMDISMPGMDGKEAAALIRAFEEAAGIPHTPIVAVTAHAMAGDEADILSAGIDMYLTKPLQKKAIVGLIVSAAGEGIRPPLRPEGHMPAAGDLPGDAHIDTARAVTQGTAPPDMEDGGNSVAQVVFRSRSREAQSA